MLALGFAIGWFAKPAADGAKFTTQAQIQEAQEMQREMMNGMLDRQRVKIGRQIDRMAETLALTPDQKSRLTGWLERQMVSVTESDISDPGWMEQFPELTGELTDEALEAQLDGTLSDDQLAALAEMKERQLEEYRTDLQTKGLGVYDNVLESMEKAVGEHGE